MLEVGKKIRIEQHIVLVGMPGSGKSLIGRKLAIRLGVLLYDTDSLIEKQQHMSISTIFEKFGEPRFRDLEQEMVGNVLSECNPAVISVGGGAFIQDKIRQDINNRALSIWIDVEIEILIKRLMKKKHRPVIEGEEKETLIADLYQKRRAIYRQSHISINNKNSPVDYTIDHVVDLIDKYQKSRTKN